MADQTNGKNGHSESAAPVEAPGPIQAQVIGQYIKDLSFENPNPARNLQGPGEAPNLKIEVNVAANRTQADIYESAIDFKAIAANKAGTIYSMDIVYAGLFRIQNIPEPALEPFLLVNCPALIFPFLRRLVADLTREGGFPPLLLDPIDFAHLFIRRKQEQAASAGSSEKSNA